MLSNEQLQTLMAVARKVHASTIAPKGYSEETVFAVMLAGAELGFEPMQSLSAFHVIQGRLSLRADFVVALCVRSPVCKHFTLVESTDKIATYETLREGHAAPTRMSFTIEQAQRAKLMGNTQWSTHPDAMLRARCSARLARAVYPDAAAGIYVPDEAEEIAANDGPRVRQIAPEAPMRALPESSEAAVVAEAPALTAFLARVAACVTSGELVAVRLAMGASLAPLSDGEKQQASQSVDAKAVDLFGNVDDYRSSVEQARAISKDPAHWTLVASVLAGLAAATTGDELKAVIAKHATASAALPDPLKKKLTATLRARQSALTAAPQVSLAAELEEALRAADGIPALDDLAERLERETKAGRLLPEQADALEKLYNARAHEYETSPEHEAA